MNTYIIAVKRELRDTAPANWRDLLRDIEGLTIRGAGNSQRVQVEASDEAIAEARRRLGQWCHIEAAIPHRPS
jgi:hypothetical protein